VGKVGGREQKRGEGIEKARHFVVSAAGGKDLGRLGLREAEKSSLTTIRDPYQR